MHTFATPMMRQYAKIKKKYADCLLFYRMGDFYELFMEDAHIGAQVLNITLTSKAGGKDGRIPMAGIPYHAVETYVAKLVKAGYKVAICEQLSPPNKKGLVERDVIRIVTPGTMLDENALEKKENNYLVSVVATEDKAALAIADISTGYFAVCEKEAPFAEWLSTELARLAPSECLLPENLYNTGEFLQLLRSQQGMNIYPMRSWETYTKNAEEFLKKQFGVQTLAAFGIAEKKLGKEAAAALLGYLQETQKTTIKHIKKLSVYETETTMVLDKATMLNLELFATIREHDTQGSLLSLLDETITAMGGRLLKVWLKKPLLQEKEIVLRHDGVGAFVTAHKKRAKLRKMFEEITDIERILSRLSVGIGNARDMINLKLALTRILDVKKFLAEEKDFSGAVFTHITKQINKDIADVVAVITKHIVDEPPIDTKTGGIIKKGVNKQLDTLRETIENSTTWMQELEKTERAATGIGSLKIRYNQVFGFYIEVSNANLHLVPSHYTRKQTLVNGERFVTADLKKHEEIILTAQEKANILEFELFVSLTNTVLTYTEKIQQAADAIAQLDCLATFAEISQKYNYVRPKILYSGEVRITEGRHPVVEKLLMHSMPFVPNTVRFDQLSQSLLLITGPNMAGKSVFIRQVALICLLNQIGCFAPAKSAHLSLVDRIFVRSGASDVITSGLSTFMVEMVETAHILNNATSNSLIVMDEIGRGTSTYDGISIAWAVAVYLVTHFERSPKTLFATHYHELQQLEKEFPKLIANFHLRVAGNATEPIFLHTLAAGGASHSFGIAVAKLAGVPEEVIQSAQEILTMLEKRDAKQENNVPEQPASNQLATTLFIQTLEKMDIANITPLQAMNILSELKEKLQLVRNAAAFEKAD